MTVAEARTERFLDRVEELYLVDQTYLPAEHRRGFQVSTPPRYASSRRTAVENLFRAPTETEGDATRSVLSEWAAYACIANPLNDLGYITEMAAPELEQGGKGRKGVDLVISQRLPDNAVVPILGLNVKMRRLRPETRTDRQHFDPSLCAPSISVSLGNWEAPTREQDTTNIRSWLNDLPPQIGASGKFPQMNHLRSYVFGRMARTLDSYLWKSQNYVNGDYIPSEMETRLFPNNWEDYNPFHQKLSAAHELIFGALKRVTGADPNTISQMT